MLILLTLLKNKILKTYSEQAGAGLTERKPGCYTRAFVFN